MTAAGRGRTFVVMTLGGMGRREFIAGAATLIVGFDVVARRWVPEARAAGSFDSVPPLDGTLHLDGPTTAGYAEDLGHIVRREPAAVLRPGSVSDIQAMVRYCRARGIAVAPRGQHHTTHGQGLTNGLIVEMGSLRRIHAIEDDWAELDAGATWRELFDATLPRGRSAPVHTGYISLSVGGTLSVGGLGVGSREGLQVDRVRELEIVDGTGELRRCSPARHADLFEAALGGLGQCGIITRAVVDLEPAPAMVRTWQLVHPLPGPFFRDYRTLLDRQEARDVWCEFFPPATGATYSLKVGVPFEAGEEPSAAHFLRGLSSPHLVAVQQDYTYQDYILRVEPLIEQLELAFGWSECIKPWFDVWLPDATVERYVREVMPTITPLDVGPGLCLLFAMRTSTLTRRFVRVPRGGRYVWLFDILNASLRPGPDPEFVRSMMARNRRLFDTAVAAGGLRYPIGALDFTAADWHHHYGDSWPAFEKAKRKYDPETILTPGPGIFG